MPKTAEKIAFSAEKVEFHIAGLKAARVDYAIAEGDFVEKVKTDKPLSLQNNARVYMQLCLDAIEQHRAVLNRVAELAIPMVDDEVLLSFVLPNVRLVADAASAKKVSERRKAESAEEIKQRERHNAFLSALMVRDENGNPVLDENGNVKLDASKLRMAAVNNKK